MPTVLAVADGEMRARSMKIIYETILDECNKNFKYENIISIEKDNEGNITMLKADTLKMNEVACNIALNSQKKLEKMGTIGIKIPMGYASKNNILANMGPNITVKMQPIESIEAKYISDFNTAGINQTRHKIYVNVKTKIKVIVPLKNNEIEVENQIPICETIIVGKVPDTSIQMDLDEAGYKN